MRPHDVNHRVSANFREVVRADHRVLVAKPHLIHPRFELNQAVDLRSGFHRPVHVADNAAARKACLGGVTSPLLERLQHPVLIETAVAKVRFGVSSKLELPTPLGRLRIDAHCAQPLQMIRILIRIYHVNCFVATFKPVLDERQQHAILIVVAVEERADMT